MGVQKSDPKLTERLYSLGISELAARDSDLAAVISKWGNPPFWTHSPGFSGIVLAILSQQVSLESAQAAFTKLEKSIGSINPERFLSLDNDQLRTIGFSRQKSSYVRGIANNIMEGAIDLDDIQSMDNEQARKSLMELRGVGPWTADTYLLFALRRADAWPSGDLALEKAVQEVRGLPTIPSTAEADRIADLWRPWRAVAARILWHHYLKERGRDSSV
jgi:DNA-3-methyladenine glycosylase II